MVIFEQEEEDDGLRSVSSESEDEGKKSERAKDRVDVQIELNKLISGANMFYYDEIRQLAFGCIRLFKFALIFDDILTLKFSNPGSADLVESLFETALGAHPK